jgi:hypothetical protein
MQFLTASSIPFRPCLHTVVVRLPDGNFRIIQEVRLLADLFGRMSNNIEPCLIAETLSGPEVLACRKGKCSEFATFCLAVASAGIPTRIALGERMMPGQWGGHMWNEVYVGRWIPVDAGANEVGKSAVLVKLIDHDQAARDGKGGCSAPFRGLPAASNHLQSHSRRLTSPQQLGTTPPS